MDMPAKFDTYRLGVVLAGASLVLTASVSGQGVTRLTLAGALGAARRVSPDLLAAREAVAASRARERQAAAFLNPTLSYGREQTSASGQTNSQNIAALEQRVELGGTRSARIDAARARRESAEARLATTESQVVYETTRAYALAAAADRRATLASQAAEAFTQAAGISQTRLAAGDESGYAHRRVRLEAARYATLRAEAMLTRRSARLALAALVTGYADSITTFEPQLVDSLPVRIVSLSANSAATPTVNGQIAPLDSLTRLALRTRGDLRALDLEAAAARADAQLASRERIPLPALSLGFKNERIAGSAAEASGFVAGISIPLPVWDRRTGAIAAADAEARRRVAEVDGLRRRVVRDVAEAYDGYLVIDQQLAALGPQLGAQTGSAMRAVQVAYSEGDATLIEYLDAVRAYQEAEASLTNLRAEALIRLAALERAVGVSLVHNTPQSGADAPAKD